MSIIKKMSEDLVIDMQFIKDIASQSTKYYSRYYIKKRNGGYREILHPSPVLKAFQYWLVNNFFYKFNISDSAYAYRKGCSIKRNAEVHQNSNHILHLDIHNFFDSITDRHLMKLFEDNVLILNQSLVTKEDVNVILKLCLYGNKLSIGSVSSPIISNIVMHDFDEKIKKIIPDNIKYTRYADDMIFSSKDFIDQKIISLVKDLLKANRFLLNTDKTRFMSTKSRRAVTGLIIDKDRVTIGLKKRKQIKSMVYNKLVYGIGNSDEILGHLFYLKDIEPNYFNMLIIKYSCYGNVIEILKNNIIKEIKATFDEVAVTK